MASHSVRVALLIGVLAAFATSAKADHCNPAPSAPCYRTITCTKWVPQYHTVKKTVNRYETRKVAYDTFKCVRVCETQCKTITVNKRVPVYKTVMRDVYENVWDYETRTVQRPHYVNQTYTVMEKKLVRKGHYECQQVEKFCSKLKGMFAKKCDPCDPCCKPHCPDYRTKKKWVKCPVYTCCPVTKCKKVCVMKTECCKVKVCRKVCKKVACKVCTYECVPCQQTVKCNVWVTKKVACKAYKCVSVCVPCQVDVRCCRMVPQTYTQQVPVAPSCHHDCCQTSRHSCSSSCCEQSCCDPCCERKRGGFFKRLFKGRNRNDCCETSCNTCCN